MAAQSAGSLSAQRSSVTFVERLMAVPWPLLIVTETVSAIVR